MGIKIFYMFAVLNILKGGETRSNTCGYFYAHNFTIQRFCTPVWSVNAPTALEVLSNGKGRTVFFCLQTKFSEMLNTEKRCLNGKHSTRQTEPSGEVLPQQLIRASQLIGEAKNLINSFHEAHPELKDCIWDDVFKADNLLVDVAYNLSNIVGVCFRDKYFFEVREEATV